MLCMLEYGAIIGLKQSGLSNRKVASKLRYDRATVSKVWEKYRGLSAKLGEEGADLKEIQALMTAEPKKGERISVRTKWTEAAQKLLDEILEEEKGKTRKLGTTHKQKRTNEQIHELFVEAKIDVSQALLNIELAKARRRAKECYIAQDYELGDRLEYDFGEVKLDCGEGFKVYHMAVFSSPGGKWRWAFLYTNQKMGVFLDSHVKMFEMLGGVFKEVVYDNMRNVVTKFLGHGEKLLNKELVAMAAYYGYIVNVTNCFSGNEKGHVENSVKTIRNRYFSGSMKDMKFANLEAAQEWLNSQLMKHNEKGFMEGEKKVLNPYKPPYELALINNHKVNKLGMICVDTCRYSVPDHLVGDTLVVKKYHNEIRAYYENELVCTHKRIFGKGNMSVNIYHYLDTLKKKPGALKNSKALKSIPRLKAIFDTHFDKEPKKFIELFIENREKDLDEIMAFFEDYAKSPTKGAIEVLGGNNNAVEMARANTAKYAELTLKGGGNESGTDKEDAA